MKIGCGLDSMLNNRIQKFKFIRYKKNMLKFYMKKHERIICLSSNLLQKKKCMQNIYISYYHFVPVYMPRPPSITSFSRFIIGVWVDSTF